MATSVTSSTQNFTASGVEKTAPAASSDSLRNSDNGASDTRFSDLLRGQMQVGIGTSNTLTAFSPAKTEATQRENREPSRNSSDPTRETRRDTAPERSPHPASKPRPEAREPQHSANQPASDTGPTAEHATADTKASATPGNPPQNDPDPQNPATPPNPDTAPIQLGNTAITPDLPATIAALLGGIAGATASTDADNNIEALPTEDDDAAQDMPTADDPLPGRSHNPAATAHDTAPHPLGAHAAPSTKGSAQTATPIQANAASIAANPALSAATFSQRADLLAAGTGTGASAATTAAAQNTNPLPLLNALRMPTQASAATPQFTIPTPIGQRGWAEEVGNRVMWMLGRAESRAELVLTPPNLGKVEVSINLNGDHTTAQFVASSQAARDALEQAMPRLRELLAQAGISLGDANVNTSAESRAQDESNARPGNRATSGHGGSDHDDATAVTSANWVKTDNGLVNTFA
jgi:flagellar hook-length control protein FliK